jgi:pilus assembly protein CpaB
MSRGRLFFLGLIALALGGFLAMSVYRNLQSRTAASNPAGADVIVAARDIQIGTRIGDGDVKTVRLPAADLPVGVFSSKSKLLGRGAILPISKGEFLLPSKLAAENSGSGLPSLIPPGMRAVSVRVNDVVAVAGFVIPGTRVDVLLTGTPVGGKEPVTTTVLENALVLAAGQRLEHSAAGEPQTVPVITLQVTPDDAQKLTLATSEGRIQLALRNLMDSEQQNLNYVGNGALYRGAARPAPEVAVRSHVTKTKAAPPPPPTVYSVEVIRGHDLSTTKF